jgi:FtsH-binding integral membrane protein
MTETLAQVLGWLAVGITLLAVLLSAAVALELKRSDDHLKYAARTLIGVGLAVLAVGMSYRLAVERMAGAEVMLGLLFVSLGTCLFCFDRLGLTKEEASTNVGTEGSTFPPQG